MPKNRFSSPISVLPISIILVFAFLGLTMFISFLMPTNYASATEAVNLSDDQRDAISQHCATTKQSLRALQRTDARTRSYLGSAYEVLLSDYIAPLNLRMINAGQPNASLTTIHSEIIETRQKFISEYTTYSQALEELISADCQNHPDEFYAKLVETREKRAVLSATTTNLRNLFAEHLTAVKRLRNSLGESNGA